MKRTAAIRLDFGNECSLIAPGKSLRDGLSVVVQTDNCLWLTNDETASLERLTLARETGNGPWTCAGSHRQFRLQDYLALPRPDARDGKAGEEADIEGLAYHDGYLWLVGSHSLKRKKPKPEDGPAKAVARLATIARDPNRYLLARIPVVEEDGAPVLAAAADRGRRSAARLDGDGEGNDLTDAIARDPHLAPFLGIPGKDNGFDIEGLAIAGQRIFLGLRGPVLRGHALILELEIRDDPDKPGVLKLKPIGSGGLAYRKHFLRLDGLGIRDLCAWGDDLLILAGPTMALDGPVAVFRWAAAKRPQEDSLVPANELERILEVPHGRGADHAEGMTPFSPAGGEPTGLLVVHDAAADTRHAGPCSVMADFFAFPPESIEP